MSLFSSLFKRPPAKAAETDAMPATVTKAGVAIGARPLVSNAIGGGYTPERVARVLTAAEQGDEFSLSEYWKLADYILEREHHSSALVHKLALSVAGLPHRAEPPRNDTSRRARKIAEDVQSLLEIGSPLRLAAPAMLTQGLHHGLAVASCQWNTRQGPWVPADFTLKPPHFFTFSRQDGRTPLLRNEKHGGEPLSLEPGLSLVFAPRRSSALQVKNGLAWPLAWIYVIKAVTAANWGAFLEAFGQPIIYAKHAPGLPDKDVGLLRQAVNQVSAHMRAVFSDTIDLKVESIAQNSTDGYERLTRYLDELASKIILAGTLNTDNGGGKGTYALGKVHAEGQYDVVRSYAQQWSAALQTFFAVYVAWNYGVDAPVPRILVDVEEDEDLVAGAEIVEKLARAGVQLDADEIREKFGFRKPEPGAEVVGGQPSQGADPTNPAQGDAAPAGASNARQAASAAGCPVHSAQAANAQPPRDAIDDLVDELASEWVEIDAAINEHLLSAVQNSTDPESLRQAVINAVESFDLEQLRAMVALARTKAHVAGDVGGEVL